MHFKLVVFPEPLTPTKPVIFSDSTVNETLFKARLSFSNNPPLKVFDKFLTINVFNYKTPFAGRILTSVLRVCQFCKASTKASRSIAFGQARYAMICTGSSNIKTILNRNPSRSCIYNKGHLTRANSIDTVRAPLMHFL